MFFVRRYIREQRKLEAEARASAEKGAIFSGNPKAQHPQIALDSCIGCGTCVSVCPEGDVLAILGGKAAIVNGHKCIGHGLCAESCPVGAISMETSSARAGLDTPVLSPEFETNIANLFVVGELGGLALIRNAVNQGRDCIDVVTRRCQEGPRSPRTPDVFDVLIVGAGPAGISASLRAIQNKLRSITIEKDELGGTVSKYPRQKLVMTSPVEFPMYGKFKHTELSKEELLAFWDKVLGRADFNIRMGERVEDIRKGSDGIFTIVTSKGQYRSLHVVLALGRAGTPRKLGIEGEDLPKVMYRLIEADHYVNQRILVVGGGDSAIEAAMGLAHQKGNSVTLSYRKESLTRIKERNRKRFEEQVGSGKLQVLFRSQPVLVTQNAVTLEVNGQLENLPNDYVWVFAGGSPPNDFLKAIGIAFEKCEVTSEKFSAAADA